MFESRRPIIVDLRTILLSLLIARQVMASSSGEMPPAKRLQVLQSIGRNTKTSTVHISGHLQSVGVLSGTDSVRRLRRELQLATESHGATMTPYGTVIQEIRLGAPGMEFWEICHPFAFLYYWTQHSDSFRRVMRACTNDNRCLRLVIYMDGLKPGNPFRPDMGRSLMSVYWAFVDWPAYMLSRTFAWPCFSILRESVMHNIPGSCSFLARVVLRTFFPSSGDSLATGIIIQGPDGPLVIKAKFCGWLADLKEHKSILEWKGTGGNVSCLKCKNLWKPARGDHADGTIGLDCHDIRKFERREAHDIYKVVADLAAIQPVWNDRRQRLEGVTRFNNMQTQTGINYVPEGLLCDVSLRGIHQPPDHIIVDWQHTLCSDGVANTCIWTTLYFLTQHGFTHQKVRDFMSLCKLPSKYGKVDPNWLHENRLHGSTLHSFSNVVLHVMPIMYLFMEMAYLENNALKLIRQYFNKMYMIVGILASGAEQAPLHLQVLRRLMQEFHALHVQLSEDLKPKLHQMHHIVDGILWLGKLLSCFVCERKHRTIKDSALHVFRHLEHTVLADVVNKQCEQLCEGIDLFKASFLVNPRTMVDVPDLHRSRTAVLPIGRLRADDVIWVEGSRCGRVAMFYELRDEIIVQVTIFEPCKGDATAFDERISHDVFIESRDVVDACTWYYLRPSIMKVAIPPLAVCTL